MMEMVKSMKKFFFKSYFSFYFKLLAINGTEKCYCVPDLSLSYWDDVHNLSLRYEEDVHNLALKQRDCPQIVSETARLWEMPPSHQQAYKLWVPAKYFKIAFKNGMGGWRGGGG